MLKTLSNTRIADAPSCGQKAARLGELVARGYRVPPSLVVQTSRFEECVAMNRPDQLRALMVESATASPQRLLDIEQQAQRHFEDAELPRRLADEVDEWVSRSDADLFAVRSSATCEDLPGASFAGQYSSYLNVEHRDLAATIRRCFASLFSARAAVYRRRKQITEFGRMAVLVQDIVQTDVAGVAFTQAPNRPQHVLVECAPGSGESVVSGVVSPNRYYLDRTTGAVEDKREHCAIDLDHVRSAARQALAIEREFGGAQDVEFGVRAGAVYILQARPVAR